MLKKGKMKTRKSAARRFRKNKAGTNVKRSQSGKRHLATGKNQARKRKLRQGAMVHDTQVEMMGRLLPYG